MNNFLFIIFSYSFHLNYVFAVSAMDLPQHIPGDIFCRLLRVKDLPINLLVVLFFAGNKHLTIPHASRQQHGTCSLGFYYTDLTEFVPILFSPKSRF